MRCAHPPHRVTATLLRAAVGHYGTEAAILLLTNAGHWLPELAAADLMTVEYDDDPKAPSNGQPAGIGWATITWPGRDPAIRDGRIVGSAGQLQLLRGRPGITGPSSALSQPNSAVASVGTTRQA